MRFCTALIIDDCDMVVESLGAGGLKQQCVALRLVGVRQAALLPGIHQQSRQPESGKFHETAGAQASLVYATHPQCGLGVLTVLRAPPADTATDP